MPHAAKVLCRGGCGRPVLKGYCDLCKGRGMQRLDRNPYKHLYNCERWRNERRLYLEAHPIAVDYFGEHNGRVMLAEVVDHIVPHCGDQVLFWDQTNWQGLTKLDHDRKTAIEDGGFGRVRVTPPRG